MLAVESSKAIRELMHSDWHSKLFGSLFDSSCVDKGDFFTTKYGGSVRAIGTEGTLTGLAAGQKRQEFGGCIIIDDPLQATYARSEAAREGINRWFTESLLSRRNSALTPIILIMQRLHKHDLVGYIEEVYPSDWFVFSFKGFNEVCERSEWELTISTKDLLALRANDVETFTAQYQQNPIVVGGSIIKTSWIRWDTPSFSVGSWQLFISADTAQKTRESSDYSVFSSWAFNGVDLYLLDCIMGKWEAPTLILKAKEAWTALSSFIDSGLSMYVSGLYVEDKSSGTGLIQTLSKETGIPVFPLSCGNRDKYTRLGSVLPFLASGKVHFALDKGSDIARQVVAELESINSTMSQQHDDFMDSLIYACNVAFNQSLFSVFDSID
jgi:predicted phage terminase large subunit-like protein